MRADQDMLGSVLGELAELEILPEAQRRRATEAASKLAGQVVYVALLGDFKRGKSTLTNALLGAPLLPVGVVPVTAVPTLCRWGAQPGLMIRDHDGERRELLEELAAFVTEAGNPGNRRRVSEVVVEYPCALLRGGVVLVDTPGMGSIHAQNTASTRAFMPRVDVALMVLTVDAPLSEHEATLLRDVAAEAARTIVCLNKVDLLTPAEVDQALAFVREGVTQALGRDDVPVVAASSRRALLGPGPDRGLEALRSWLVEHVAGERASIAHERAAQVAASTRDLAATALRLERQALDLPADESHARRDALARALEVLEVDAREATALLADAGRRIVAGTIAMAADQVREELPRRLLKADDRSWPALEREAAAQWTARVGATAQAELEPVVQRHAQRLEERTQRFLTTAAELFALSLPPARRVAESLRLPSVRIEVADEPGALAMSIRGLRAHLPGTLGRSWREADRRRRAAETAD